jgi:5-oxoprolinase (ATP-hydrolysing) subunit A
VTANAPASIDLNSDLGESFGVWERGADESLLQVISSANVACGFHAGDPTVMRSTVAVAKRNGVAVGAHPGYPDLLGYGRRRMDVEPSQLRNYILYQVGALGAFLTAAGLRMHHVKPHGALYMAALEDDAVARCIAEAAAEYQEGIAVYTLAGSEMWHAAERAGLRAVSEFFADRPLRSDGSVVMFGWQQVFEPAPETVAERVRSLVTTGKVASLEGGEVAVVARTICVHSDTPGAGDIGRAVKRTLEDSQLRVVVDPPAGSS